MNKLNRIVSELFPDADFSRPETLSVGACKGWDSLGHFNLIMAIEEKFDVRFTIEEISESKSLEQIVRALSVRGIQP